MQSCEQPVLPQPVLWDVVLGPRVFEHVSVEHHVLSCACQHCHQATGLDAQKQGVQACIPSGSGRKGSKVSYILDECFDNCRNV